MLLDDLLYRLNDASQRGDQYTACCPAHDDKSPSLSLTEKEGKILLNCWAGCTCDEIVDALGLKLSDLFTDNGMTVQQRQKYAKKKNKHQLRKVLSFELHMLFQILTCRITSADLINDAKFLYARPEFVPMPEESWERELLAVRRIVESLNDLYKNQ